MRHVLRSAPWLPAVAAGVIALSSCAEPQEGHTAATSQAVQGTESTDDSLEPGQQDVLEDGVVLGPETQGTRGPPQPGDPVYKAKLAAYFAALEQATIGWAAAGMSQAEIDERGGQLREQMMDGERP